MQAHNHESTTFAFVTTSALVVGARPLPALVLGIIGMWAADWPDIDAEKSRIISMLWFAPWFPWALKWWSAFVWDWCATEEDRRDRTRWGYAFRVHRGFWHSLWGALATGIAWWSAIAYGLSWWSGHEVLLDRVSKWFGLGYPVQVLIPMVLTLGMVGHILGDGCTDFAVAPLAPVWKWKGRRYVRMGLWRPLRFKVGDLTRPTKVGEKAKPGVEKLVITPLCVGLVCWSLLTLMFGLWDVRPLLGLPIGVIWALLPVGWVKKLARPLVNALPRGVIRRRAMRLLVVK